MIESNNRGVYGVLDHIRNTSPDTRTMGTKFEKLIARYLVSDPLQKQMYAKVYMWSDFPKDDLNAQGYELHNKDTGIDLVAVTHNGEYHAVQCKMYDADHNLTMSDLKGFMTLSGKTCFSSRVIVTTVLNWTDDLDKALAHQSKPLIRINLQELDESLIDWNQYILKDSVVLKDKKELRPHQRDAFNKTMEHMVVNGGDRGRIIMACGTGKTITSIRIAEKLVPDGGLVLVAVPSITLLAQTLREWAAESVHPIRLMAVCSDASASKDEDSQVRDIGYPSTTDPETLLKQYNGSPHNATKVIITTYHSMQVIIDAQNIGLPVIDVVLADEAHRTTGLDWTESRFKNKLDTSSFILIHGDRRDLKCDDQHGTGSRMLLARKRIYMTATPRIYSDKTKSKANTYQAHVYSMDNSDIYGDEMYRLDFGTAATGTNGEQGILCDFKVIIVAVRQSMMSKFTAEYNRSLPDIEVGEREISPEFAAQIIGTWKALSKDGVESDDGDMAFAGDTAPMRSAIAFSSRISSSKLLMNTFNDLIKDYSALQESDEVKLKCHVDHVDGTMSMNSRHKKLDKMNSVEDGDCYILSNARCLSEGVDVPALDAVMFFDRRESMIDIVQAVGRVMRRSEGKNFGYIILPVAVPDVIDNPQQYVKKDREFGGIWKVIEALRAHDSRLVDESEYKQRIKVVTPKMSAGEQTSLGLESYIPIPLKELNDAVYAVMPEKVGDREYWKDWATSIAVTAEELKGRMRSIITDNGDGSALFNSFFSKMRSLVSPSISEDDALNMLVQHTITKPIFDMFFSGMDSCNYNPVSIALDDIMKVMTEIHRVSTNMESSLKDFYSSVSERISLAKSDKSKQDIIRSLYDTFFRRAFPMMSEKLGIVYTPVELVDFIINSTEYVLNKHLSSSMSDENVHVLDPFTGTGTFITRLLQSDIIKQEDVERKYKGEIYANELVLLAHYIASLNIQTVYHERTGKSAPFDGIALTDTFKMCEDGQQSELEPFMKVNTETVNKQNGDKNINVIIGNPPYSAKQKDANDNNANDDYEYVDNRIAETYLKVSGKGNKNSMYDSYIRAFRWASDRIGDHGVVSFVSNGGWLDSQAMDGFRKTLSSEFSHIYIYNLKGNIRKNNPKVEGDNIFKPGCQTNITVSILVKDRNHVGGGVIHYAEVGDGLTTKEKIEQLTALGSVEKAAVRTIEPNEHGDWLSQRSEDFVSLYPMGDNKGGSDKTIFSIYSGGIVTGRDIWAVNFSKDVLYSNIGSIKNTYSYDLDRLKNMSGDISELVTYDHSKIKWDSALLGHIKRKLPLVVEESFYRTYMYRPFIKTNACVGKSISNTLGRTPSIFPNEFLDNIAIVVSGLGVDPSVLITNTLCDLSFVTPNQCFPLYSYTKVEDHNSLFGPHSDATVVDGYERHENITDISLSDFREHYEDISISKEDIFYYVYGILHSPEYRERYKNDFSKMLPRIPFAPDFWAFSRAGRELAYWHLKYEEVKPYDAEVIINAPADVDDYDKFAVRKMKYGGGVGDKKDVSTIIYNDWITIKGIPEEVQDYAISGKAAIYWVMSKYAYTADKDSGIINDPNDWSKQMENPRYILDLLLRVVAVSMETTRLVKTMPSPF